MSIYASMESLMFPLPDRTPHIGGFVRDGDITRLVADRCCQPPYHTDDLDHFIEVFFQGVPAHIGHPHFYEVDDCADFLPPPPANDDGRPYRAVVIVPPWSGKGTARHGQEYELPLLVLCGDEYNRIGWVELWERIEQALLEPRHAVHWAQ